MSNLPQIFNYEAAQIRVVAKDGEPWFVAKDVCDILELGDTGRAIERLDSDESTRIEIDHPQSQEKSIEVYAVNEPGLYSLVLGSRKPEAKSFKRWITHEVIPAIRKTGSYNALPAEIMNDPIIAIRYEQIQMEKRIAHVETETDEAKVDAAAAKEQAELAHKRINELDNANLIGDMRQRLVRKVQRYAERNCLTYSQGWKDFRQFYNTAFHTNLSLRKKYYMESNGIKSMTVPEYLEAKSMLPDALRIAEKMLQPRQAFTLV